MLNVVLLLIYFQMDGAPLRVDHMSTMMGSSAMNKSLHQNRAPSPKSPFTGGNAKVKQRQRASLTKKATSQPLNAAANVAKVALKAAAATEAAKKAAAAKSGATNQVWSLSQFYSVNFSQSIIIVEK